MKGIMKKLNRKGFTLIELLAVILILLSISVIAVSSITSAIERNKVKQNEAKIDIILSYAKLYYDEHKNSETDVCINLSDLKLSDDELTDAYGNSFEGVVKHTNGTNFTFDTNISSCL